jgi:hypothetical protein
LLGPVVAAEPTEKTSPAGVERIDEAVDLATAYLLRGQQPDGRFLYRTNLNPRVSLAPQYNILRHAGAMYALAAYHELRGDVVSQRALVEAGRFLHSQMGYPAGQGGLIAVWSRPAIEGTDGPPTAKLGGAGLGLVALVGIERVAPGFTPREVLDELGRFVLYMQKDDGSFHSKYTPAHGGRDDRWVSLYYPGEAALGLLMLYKLDPHPRWLQGAADAIGYLAQSRAAATSLPPDHWALIATAELLPVYDRCQPKASRELVIEHASRICRQMLDAQKAQLGHSRLRGCFEPDGRTTPTATRLEGLLASLKFLPASQAELRHEIGDSCHLGVEFLLRCQVTNGNDRGAVPMAIGPPPDVHNRSREAFRRGISEVRVDYVQHFLSALLEYRERFFEKPHAKPSTPTGSK